MNTNELRKLANRAIQECMYSDFYAAANPATVTGLLDEIDRLTREAVAADIRIANDALEIAELTKLAVSRYDEIANLIQQRDAALAAAEQGRDALQAKITVLEGHAHTGLLEAFDAYARQLTYNSHPAKPEHFPKSFIWFSAGYSAAGAASVPEGWQLVPIEPTDAMLVSARDWSYAKYGKPIGNTAAVGCWEAMLSAAPKDARTKETK